MPWNASKRSDAAVPNGTGRAPARRLGYLSALVLFAGSICAPASAQEAAVPSLQRQYDHAVAAAEKATDQAGYAAAIAELRAIIAAAPQWPAPQYSLGMLLAKAGQPGEAAQSLRTYLALQPGALNSDSIRRLIADLDAKADQSSALERDSCTCFINSLKVNEAISEGRLSDAAGLLHVSLPLCHEGESKAATEEAIRTLETEIAERRRRASFPLKETTVIGAPPNPVFGLQVDSFDKSEPPSGSPNERQKEKQLLRSQLDRIGLKESQFSSPQDQDFIIDVARSGRNLDTIDRMFADGWDTNPQTAGLLEQAANQALRQLEGNRFDILDCFGAAADFCLVMLEKGRTVASKVRLLGPFLSPSSLDRWGQLAEPGGLGNRIQSLEIIISSGDPVPLLSYKSEDMMQWILHSDQSQLKQYLFGERLSFELENNINKFPAATSFVNIGCEKSNYMFERRCHDIDNYASQIAGVGK